MQGDSIEGSILDGEVASTSGSNGETIGSGNSLSGDGSLSGTCIMKYEGTHCKEVLQSRTECLLGKNTDDIFISSRHNNYMKVESDIAKLLFALNSVIRPSKECKAYVVPFLCFYMFGLCSETNDDHQPTAAECFHVKDNVCKSEWETANNLLSGSGTLRLPECGSFSSSSAELLCTNEVRKYYIV